MRAGKVALIATFVVMLAFVLVVLTASAAPSSDGHADYAGEPLDGGAVCLEDRTAGFPVQAAAEEFDGIVDVAVTDDCSGWTNHVNVVLVIRDESWSGWYNAPDEDGEAWISLNVSQAFRHDPHGWRMILVHEIGHAPGLEHTYETESVMHPMRPTEFDGLTAADREQLAVLYGG